MLHEAASVLRLCTGCACSEMYVVALRFISGVGASTMPPSATSEAVDQLYVQIWCGAHHPVVTCDIVDCDVCLECGVRHPLPPAVHAWEDVKVAVEANSDFRANRNTNNLHREHTAAPNLCQMW